MNKKNASFEEKMQRLEQIVRAMEQGDVLLNDSIKLFQEGTDLVRDCGKMLDGAELEVKKILVKEDGSYTEEDFSDAADA